MSKNLREIVKYLFFDMHSPWQWTLQTTFFSSFSNFYLNWKVFLSNISWKKRKLVWKSLFWYSFRRSKFVHFCQGEQETINLSWENFRSPIAPLVICSWCQCKLASSSLKCETSNLARSVDVNCWAFSFRNGEAWSDHVIAFEQCFPDFAWHMPSKLEDELWSCMLFFFLF